MMLNNNSEAMTPIGVQLQSIEVFNNPEFGSIRTTLLNGKPMFVAVDVARALTYSDPRSAVSRFCQKSNPEHYAVTYIPHENGSGGTRTTVVDESLLYKFILKSEAINAEPFQDWVCEEVIPSIRNKGYYITPTNLEKERNFDTMEKLEISRVWMTMVSENLNLNEHSRLKMLDSIRKATGIEEDYVPLPEYVQADPMSSLSDLLKENNIPNSAKSVNVVLEENGYVKTVYRTASGGKKKSYKILTEKGLEYGQNFLNEHSQRDSQPRYYRDKFLELMNKIGCV